MKNHLKNNDLKIEIHRPPASMNPVAGRKIISQTAEAFAMFRAIASMDPDKKINNNDVFAEKFVPLVEKCNLYLKAQIVRKDFAQLKRIIKINHASPYFYANARAKHGDAILTDALKNGTTQVIILGAGYASHAYRFHGAAPDVKFFEVDLPEIQVDKIKKVNEIFGKLPDWVTYCPIDFQTQTLEIELKKAGYDESKKSHFIWEGVTYFIGAAAVGSTLQFIADHSAPGSSVVFDYLLRPVIEGDFRYYGASMAVGWVTIMGEPYIFGIHDGEVESFINQKGLSLISDLGPPELTQKYLIRSNGKEDGRMMGHFRIAYAKVPDKTVRDELMKITYKEVNPEPAPETHTVMVPADVQSFFDQFNKDFLAHDHGKIMTNYSDKFLDDGATKGIMSYLWMIVIQYPFVKAATSRKIILTNLRIDGNIAHFSGFAKSNTCYDLEEGTIIKENGKWKLYGNQKTADED
ncbi:MAG TPA: SAM-dependent methyltransferase [Syntrophales bacterium]|nr:SAM-dependent methyltransferase [Syntrophales bacterium]